MAIQFNAGNVLHNYHFNYANRRAAKRQTEAQRQAVFDRYSALVGTVYKNSLAARRAALYELNDPQLTPEYWDKDTKPRRELNITSSCIKSVTPYAGGCFIQFQNSKNNKSYFYPCAGTTAETAKRIYNLVKSRSLGTLYHNGWGSQNGAKKVMSKSGKSYSYKLNNGRSLNLAKFDKIGKKLGG